MKVLELAGNKRVDTGKKSTKKLRLEGLVPCVIYEKEENIHFSISEKALRPLLFTPNVYILAVNIDGVVYDSILQDIQYHPVADNVLHVDFFQLSDDKKVIIEIPVVLEGFPIGVKAGGKLSADQRKLKVRALKADLPDTLTVDVEELALGRSIKVRDLSFDNIELLSPGNSVVAAVRLTRAAKGEMAEGEEGEEGENSAETEATPAAE